MLQTQVPHQDVIQGADMARKIVESLASATFLTAIKPTLSKARGLARKSKISMLHKRLGELNTERRNLVIAKRTSPSDAIDPLLLLVDNKRDKHLEELREEEELYERIAKKQYWPLAGWKKLTLWFTPRSFRGWLLVFFYNFFIFLIVAIVHSASKDLFEYWKNRHVDPYHWLQEIKLYLPAACSHAIAYFLLAAYVRIEALNLRSRTLGGTLETPFVKTKLALPVLLASLPALGFEAYGCVLIFELRDDMDWSDAPSLLIRIAAYVGAIVWVWTAYLKMNYRKKKTTRVVSET